MALIKCHECGNEVSAHATACHRCGAPLLPSVTTIGASLSFGCDLVPAAMLHSVVANRLPNSSSAPFSADSFFQPIPEARVCAIRCGWLRWRWIVTSLLGFPAW